MHFVSLSLFFKEFMYPQNYKVFPCQIMVKKLIKNFYKILSEILHWWQLNKGIKKK